MKQLTLKAAAAAVLALGLSAGAHAAGLVNFNFEALAVDSGAFGPANSPNWDLIPQTTAGMGWQTTATDGLIEVWKQPGALQPGGGQSIPAYEGTQYAELNATQASSLFQTATFNLGDQVSWTFAHRGRVGVDVAAVTITDTVTNQILANFQFADGTGGWGLHTSADAGNGGNINITAALAGHSLKFAFSAISSAGGNLLEGNLIDAANFGVGVLAPPAVPEPSSLLLAGLGLFAAGRALRRRA